MAIANNSGERMQPWRTPVVTWNHPLVSPFIRTALQQSVYRLYHVYYLLWQPIPFENFPQCRSVDAVKRFAEVDGVYYCGFLTFRYFLYDLPERKDLVYTGSPLSEACLLLT